MTDSPQEGAGVLAQKREGPDWRPIAEIHRAHDGLITFHRKEQRDGNEVFHSFAIQAVDLHQYFPGFAEELERDSYFSLLGYTKPPEAKGILKGSWRKAKNVRWLNVAWVDCDCYNVGATWAAAVGVVQAMQDKGMIPPASFLVRSGRGLWLLWLLRGEGNPSLGEQAEHNVQLWAMVQRELASRLRIIGADTAAGDAARCARIPGSINPKAETGERVAYLLQGRTGGQGYSYTLPELASFLGLGPGAVEAPPPLLPRPKHKAEQPALPMPPGEQLHRHREKPKTAKHQRAVNGWQARAKNRLSNFAILRDLRGGFREPHRNRAARLYAGILWSAGYRGDTLRGVLEEFAQRHCKPPLYPGEVSGAVRGAGNRECWAIKTSTISEWLEITPDEAQVLSGWYAKGVQPPAPPPAHRKQEAARRRALEADLIRSYYGGRCPPLRALQAQLVERGVEAVLRTIQRDLKALGIGNPRARRGRQLPLDLGRELVVYS